MVDGLILWLDARKPVVLAVLFAFALAFPFLAPNSYLIYVMSLAFIMAISAAGLNLILGYTGQLNLAHAGFMAIGAYTVGILTVDHHWPFWAAFALSGVVAAACTARACGRRLDRLVLHALVILHARDGWRGRPGNAPS